MIVSFFILSPRGDTVIAKTYRSKSSLSAHERSHTEAFFRKVKFWDGVAPGTPGMDTTLGLKGSNRSDDGGNNNSSNGAAANGKKAAGTLDAPPVFVMPDGYSYMHVKRNGLIFGCATEKNVSPVVVIEVRRKRRVYIVNCCCYCPCFCLCVLDLNYVGDGCAFHLNVHTRVIWIQPIKFIQCSILPHLLLLHHSI